MMKTMTRRTVMGLMATSAAAMAFARPTLAQDDTRTIVQVNMWDNGADQISGFDMERRVMLGTPDAAFKNDAPMGFTPNKYVIPHGDVTFVATNTSELQEHEMIVIPIADVTAALPYDTDSERLDEDAAGAIGEVPETKPGETGSVTLRLDPGTYMLACNIAGHYAMGMWTLITVI